MKIKLLVALLASSLWCGWAQAQIGDITNPLNGRITVVDAGTCSTANSFVTQQLPQNASTTTVNLSGTFTATLTARLSNNGGATWTTGGAVAAGTTSFSTNGYTHICVDATAFTSGTVLVSISTGILQVQSVVAGGSSSSSPSSAYTFSVSGGTVTASPNASGLSTFTGSDACVVFNQVTTALGTVGGRLFFKNGVYTCNSLTNESATGCSSFDGSGKQLSYALGFPAVALANSVQWLLEGESTTVWLGEEGITTVNNSGVVFNITPAAVSSVTANNILAGFFQRPLTNCTMSAGPGLPSNNIANDVHYKNMTLRFPVNTRGNEIAFAAYFNLNVEYENVVADFNVGYNTIATGAAPTKGSYGSFGLTTTVSGSGNYQDWRNTFAVGYDIGYDFQSEHVTGHTLTAIYNNFACEFGRDGTAVFHPIKLGHFVDQENGAGCIWGPQMIQASAVDVDFDFEFGNDANWYSTARAKTAKLTETNCNIGTGIIRYGVVVAFQGSVAEVPGANLFTTCGQNFTFQEVAQPLNYAQSPALDTFTRPNSSSLGPAWAVPGTGIACNMAIASNTATSGGGALCVWVSQAANADQFSQATINAVDASGVAVIVRASLSANTYNDYLCTSNAGQLIRKRVAGTFTTIATSATNCANADKIKLVVVGTNYFAYRNGILSLTATDAAVTAGFPGIVAGAVTDSLTNWSGGSLPLADQVNSQASQPFFASTYYTQTNCSSSGGTCGSASSGSVSIAAAATTVTVSTTAVTANSVIILSRDDTLGTKLGVTCNTATAAGDIKASTRTAGTSFVITVQNAPAANPLCLNYWIVN